MTDDASPWQPPRSFDEYELLEPIGNGSMGQVYKALDTLLQRVVAVKLIRSRAPDQAQRERFRTEARAIARVQHPNVVEIYRIGEVQGRPYLVSELVHGRSLDRLELPLPWERALGIAIDLARGLAAVHRRGVLHRDIKPANVMLTDDDAVKLLDFGVAKLLDAAGGPPRPRAAPGPEDLSGDQTVDAVGPARPATPADVAPGSSGPGLDTGLIGTPRYMAPEVSRQEAATPRSDLYSFGVLLYQLCAGALPEQDATPLARRAPQVNPAFAALIDRCLARDPEQRFASAEALREALEALRGGREEAGLRDRPYPGLHAFGAEDRSTFFGRDAQVRAVVDRLRGEPVVLVAGDSGAGKSSLCRAGVLPRVVEGALGAGGAWATCELLPGRRPLQALAAALAPLVDGGEAELLSVLEHRPLEVGRWALQKARTRGAVVFVHQLEEALTLADPGELEPFAGALRSLAGSGPRLRVLATARGDFLARLAELPGLGELLSSGLYLLPHLGEAGLRDAITAPARAQGYTFESEAMIDSLVAAGRAEGGLPLLQFALAELWERRDRERRAIPAGALVALGGVEGALARHADGVLAQMRSEPRAAARALLSRLVLAEGTRARRTRAELLGQPGSEDGAARAALEALVRGRLVLGREAPDGTATYELAHEALVRGWDTLRGWLANDQELRAVRQRLERACAEWERLGRPREQLWGRRQLVEARALDARELSAAEASFLGASRRAARRRTWLAAAALLIAPVYAAGAYGVIQARDWRARERDVAQVLVEVDGAMARAAEKGRQVEQLRRTSFDAFDGRRSWKEAEGAWADALKLGAEEAALHDEAIAILDRALDRNRDRPELRGRLAEVLYRYIAVAERDHHQPVRALLQRRLEAMNDAGEYRRRLRQPAHVEVQSEPAPARVRVEQAVETGDGPLRKLRWVPLSPLEATTPLSDLSLPPGSYRLRLRRLDRPEEPEVLYPVLLQPGERLQVRVPMPASVPEGYAYVAPGRFLSGSTDDESIRLTMVPAPPLHQETTGGFLISRHEVTYGEWIAYLGTLGPAERAQRRPHGENYFGIIRLDPAPDGRWEFVMTHGPQTYRVKEGERLRYPDRDHRAEQDWLRFPVSSISWEDGQQYLSWLDRTGRLPGARMCTESEWERAARGADGREYPHGNLLEPEDANFDLTYGQKQGAFGPDEVGSHPASDSPFGVADLAGNVGEWVVRTRPEIKAAYAVANFYQDRMAARSLNHGPGEPAFRFPFIGLRACAPPPPP
ncbi:MAG TPA: protein kinase [Myxococcales bacterium]|nr:protein kinase [Myxococcales bacterium]